MVAKNQLINTLLQMPSTFPGIVGTPPEIVYLMGCRSFEQFCCTARSIMFPEKFCPFCTPEMHRRGRKPLATIRGWQLIENEFPHKNTRVMLLAVPLRHLTSMADMVFEDWADMGALLQLAAQWYDIASGGVIMRFGNPQLNAGTVEHLHVNLIVPGLGREYRPPLSKDPDEYTKDYARLLGFRAQLMERGYEQWLYSPAGIEETQPTI